MRCFIMDNHRPLHLANIYSRHSVVVFDDTYDVNGDEEEGGGGDTGSIPCDGSDLSGGISSSDSDDSSSEEEDDGEDEDLYDEVSGCSFV